MARYWSYYGHGAASPGNDAIEACDLTIEAAEHVGLRWENICTALA